MAASRVVVYECSDGTGFNVLMEAPGLPHQWHWASRTRNFPNRETVERYVQNCAGPDTVIVERGGYRSTEGALPDEWIVPETVVYYAGGRQWRPSNEVM